MTTTTTANAATTLPTWTLLVQTNSKGEEFVCLPKFYPLKKSVVDKKGKNKVKNTWLLTGYTVKMEGRYGVFLIRYTTRTRTWTVEYPSYDYTQRRVSNGLRPETVVVANKDRGMTTTAMVRWATERGCLELLRGAFSTQGVELG